MNYGGLIDCKCFDPYDYGIEIMTEYPSSAIRLIDTTAGQHTFLRTIKLFLFRMHANGDRALRLKTPDRERQACGSAAVTRCLITCAEKVTKPNRAQEETIICSPRSRAETAAGTNLVRFHFPMRVRPCGHSSISCTRNIVALGSLKCGA